MDTNKEKSVIICTEYTKDNIAEQICGLSIRYGMIVFGGYVRDKYILGLNDFHDIDITYFNGNSLEIILEMLNDLGYIISTIKNVSNIDTNSEKHAYFNTSSIITELKTIRIVGKDCTEFPETMQFNVDFVKCDNQEYWKDSKEVDFSCNLFYLDKDGLGIRYNPGINIISRLVDPFTYFRKMTIERKFILVSENVQYKKQILKVHARALKLIKAGWKMHRHITSQFVVGTFKQIGIPDRETCPVCIEDFIGSDFITITKCGHAFCNTCFTNHIKHDSDNKICPKCPVCRDTYSKRN